MKFTSHTQAGQDAFLNAVLGGKTDGFFVDIGCSHPVELSNTYALEQLGWSGIMIDASADAIRLCREQRKSPAVICDARTCVWRDLIRTHQPTWGDYPVLSYASVDVDEHTTLALQNLIRGSAIRFAVITVEHDQYQRGDRIRGPNRDLLMRHGYEIIAADVHSNGCCFEDWAVAPDLVDMKRVEPFRSNDLDWADVLRKGGAL